jgi:hypothetical protein
MNSVPCVLQLPEELEKAIGTMTRNEKALIYISHAYCSPASYSLNLNVPPEAEELEFEVELIQLIQVSELNQSARFVKWPGLQILVRYTMADVCYCPWTGAGYVWRRWTHKTAHSRWNRFAFLGFHT